MHNRFIRLAVAFVALGFFPSVAVRVDIYHSHSEPGKQDSDDSWMASRYCAGARLLQGRPADRIVTQNLCFWSKSSGDVVGHRGIHSRVCERPYCRNLEITLIGKTKKSQPDAVSAIAGSWRIDPDYDRLFGTAENNRQPNSLTFRSSLPGAPVLREETISMIEDVFARNFRINGPRSIRNQRDWNTSDGKENPGHH